METKTQSNRKSGEGNIASIMEPPYTVSAVTSNDGAKIGYRQYGIGPGVILVMGAGGAARRDLCPRSCFERSHRGDCEGECEIARRNPGGLA